ncbi:MAG TPA: hypothetical protein VGY56_00255 [Verrucomicrobiae bacterium]|nr:hypothetical protein [Verrucomicrobiae bacterium]
MSLLNEALKRASQSQQEFDTVRIHLPPAVAASNPHAGRRWTFSIVVILLIAIASALIWRALFEPNHVPPVSMAAAVPPPVHVVPAAPKPAMLPVKAHTVAVAAPAPVLPPQLKLQGITYYNARWQAIINGKTAYVGDYVNGFRVAVISRNYVSFIAPDGSKRMMPFGE